MHRADPTAIAATAVRLGCRSVAFTYNDPVIFLEYAIDTVKACRPCHRSGDRWLCRARSAPGILRPNGCRECRSKGVHRGFLPDGLRRHLEGVLDTLVYLNGCWLRLLRRAMIKALDQAPSTQRTYPVSWAPFVVVGDGGPSRKAAQDGKEKCLE